MGESIKILICSFNFGIIILILIISSFFDLKNRTVSLKIFKIFITIAIFTLFFEFFFFLNNNLFHFLGIKLLVLIVVFFISFFLFIFKIIGGADGKVIIIIFLIHPLKYLKFLHISLFYLLFSLGFILYFLFQFLVDNISGKGFFFDEFISKLSKNTILRRLFLKAFYQFNSLLKIEKFLLNSSIHKSKEKKIQLLIHNRPPLIFIITIVYITMLFFGGF